MIRLRATIGLTTSTRCFLSRPAILSRMAASEPCWISTKAFGVDHIDAEITEFHFLLGAALGVMLLQLAM